MGMQTPFRTLGAISMMVISISPMEVSFWPAVAIIRLGRASIRMVSAVSQATSPPPRMQTLPELMTRSPRRKSCAVSTG